MGKTKSVIAVTGTEGADTLNGTSGNDTIYGLGGSDSMYGLAGSDFIVGGDGDDFVDGGLDHDHLDGGPGNDTLVVDNALDTVIERTDGGTDRVLSSVDYSLHLELEHLTLTGAAVSGTGNYRNNEITGNAGDNILDGREGDDVLHGGEGSDTMVGGTGHDSYYVDSIGDIVTEGAGEGIDVVASSVSYTLTENVENLVLTGAGATSGTGNSLDNYILGRSAANTLVGGGGNDTLDGGAGADTLVGGIGDDAYYVDNIGDIVTEGAGEGIDLVAASVSYTLTADVESLVLTGTSEISGTGNSLDNYIAGNSAANTLIGGGGNDTLDGAAGADNLVGGTGGDTYYVDSIGDVITEGAGGGIDTVSASVSYTLAANVEHLVLTGAGATSGTGNSLDNYILGRGTANTLAGGSGNDTLDGGAGADSLAGGTGDDTYYVDNIGDIVTEGAGEGIDLVASSVSYTLAADVERLVLTGATEISATGNGLDNYLAGNSAANTLAGGGGNDTLDGGGGADTLIGGTGHDTYYIDSVGDIIAEGAGEGIDGVDSTVSYTLAANVEHLVLTGTGATSGTGNSLDNAIAGNSAANTLAGGGGNDSLTGGAGADSFLFDSSLDPAANVDRILDFSAIDDTLVLDQSVFQGLTATGEFDASAFHAGTAAQEADDRIIYDSATGSIYYDADGNGEGSAVLFAQVNPATALTSSDFLIIG